MSQLYKVKEKMLSDIENLHSHVDLYITMRGMKYKHKLTASPNAQLNNNFTLKIMQNMTTVIRKNLYAIRSTKQFVSFLKWSYRNQCS